VSLKNAFVALKKDNIFTPENRDALIKSNPANLWLLAAALVALQRDRILTQDNFNAVKSHTQPQDAAKKLIELNKKNISPLSTFSFFAHNKSAHPPSATACLVINAYKKHKGSQSKINTIFKNCTTFEGAIEALQARYNTEKNGVKTGAAYLTLQEFGLPLSSLSSPIFGQ